MKWIRRFFIPFLGFLVGSFFFFPWNEVRDIVSAEVAKNTGVQINMSDFSPSLGVLSLGISRGSVIAFSAKNASLRLPSGQSMMCKELILGPRVWPFFLGQIQLSVGCLSDQGSTIALLKASPFWAPDNLDVSAEFDNFSLANVTLHFDVSGILSGTLDIAEMSLDPKASSLPKVDWNLKGKEIHTPEYQVPLLKLPALDLADLETEGSFTQRGVKIPTLNFGSKTSTLEARMSFNSDLSATNMMPENGDIKGWIRIDPSAESSSLKDIPWNIFGKVGDNGRREFKRPFTGGIQSLLFSSPTP